MSLPKLCLVAAVAAVVFCLSAGPARATTIYLDTSKLLNLSQGASGNMTFSFTNDAGYITSNFLAWTVGLQVLPSGSVSGNITLGTLSQ